VKTKIIRTALAMANCRDGGTIVVGVCFRATPLKYQINRHTLRVAAETYFHRPDSRSESERVLRLAGAHGE